MTLYTLKNDHVEREMQHYMVPQNKKVVHYTLWVCLLWLNTMLSTLLRVSAAQVILPGRNPEVYLPPRCDGFALNGLHHGVIFSHHTSTDTYSPNTDCTVFFSVKTNQVVHFHFEDFSLQNRIRGKCVDYVQFFAGDLLDKPITEPLCGQSVPKPLSSNHSRIALLFHSNAKHETTGFKVRFKRSDVICDAKHSECSRSSHWKDGNTSYLLALPVLFLIFPALMVGLALYLHCS